jgi:hypothetical protein
MYLGMDMQVRSMGCGLLDSIYDAIHVFNENKLSSSPIPNTTTEVMEIELPSKENAKSIAKGSNDSNEPRPSNLSLSLSLVLTCLSQLFAHTFWDIQLEPKYSFLIGTCSCRCHN